MVKIKQQPDHDWSAGSEMKWVTGTNESVETKGKFAMGRLTGPMMSQHRGI